MLVGLLKAWENGSCSCWTTWHWFGVLQRAAVVPQVSTTLVARAVSSLDTFTIPVCRWIASETNPADEPSRTKRYRPRTHSDVDQYEMSTTGLTPDSELFTLLSAEAARVAGEEVQPRKPSRVRSCTDAADTCQGRTNTYPKATRRRRAWAAPPPQRVVFPEPSRHNPGSVLRSHTQRVSGLLKNDEKRAEVIGKARQDGGKELQTRSGKGVNDGKEVCRMESDLPRPVQSLKNYRRLAPGTPRGPTPRISAAAAMMEMGVLKRRGVCGGACCPLRNVVEAQRMVQPDGWSSRSSSARVRREQMSPAQC